MDNESKGYLPLEALAANLGLSQSYLRGLAKRRLIPYLDVNGRLRFDEAQVRAALIDIAGVGFCRVKNKDD